jgi:hypothetical protein
MNYYSSFTTSQIKDDNLALAVSLGAEVADGVVYFIHKSQWKEYRAIIGDKTLLQQVLQKLRIGDKIHDVTKLLNIPHCESCAARKRKLNGG